MQNMTEENIIIYLKSRLVEKRFQHSINVMHMSVKLAKMYGANEDDAKFAGLLHDCAKNMANDELIAYCEKNGLELDEIKKSSPGILHSDVGADIAKKEFGANDEIVQAIKNHTLGNVNPTLLDKIIYISDLIEEGRDLPGLDEIRKVVYNNIDKGYIVALEYCMQNVGERGKTLHKQSVLALEDAKNKLAEK